MLQTGQLLPPEQQGGPPPTAQASDTDMAAASSPGFGTTFGAAMSAAKDQTWTVAQFRLNSAYSGLADQLATQTGQPVDAYYMSGQSDTKASPMRIWQTIAARRQTDPDFMKDVGSDQADFEKRVLTRGGQHQIDAATASAGGWLPNLLGTAAAGVYDPFQWVAATLGGPEVGTAARSIVAGGLARVGVAAATNAAFAAAEEPMNVATRQQMGETVTPGDVAQDIGGAAVFGGALHLGGELLGPVARSAAQAAAPVAQPIADTTAAALRNAGDQARTGYESALAKVYSALPDSVLQQHFADKTAPFERTPDEQAALNVLGRQGEIDATNPYQPSYAAMAVHQARLAQAGAALDDGRVAQGGAFANPPSSGPQAAYFDRLATIESGGRANASPGTSSAKGLYQFTDQTWLNLYKAHFGSAGQTDAQILALKTDNGLQNTLVRDLTHQNAAALAHQGIAPTDPNLYLAHFAGPDDAARIINADPATPISDVMRARSIEANPWLRGKTAGDVRAWAERKMGTGGATVAAPIATGDDTDATLAASDAADAGLEADEAAAPYDQEAPPGPDGGTPAELPLSVQTLMPALRAAVADKTVRLNRFDDLAQSLGASSEDVQRGLSELVRSGELRQRSDNGSFTRAAPPARELSLIQWIKANGGITDPGGDFAAMGLNDWYKGGPFRDKKPIIAPDGTPDRGADTVMRAAVEAGYFPEHRAALDAKGPDALDTNDLHKAIDHELRGHPRYPMASSAWEKAVGLTVSDDGRLPPGEAPITGPRTMDEAFGNLPEHLQSDLSLASIVNHDRPIESLDPWIVDRAHYLWHETTLPIDEALDRAVNDYAAKNAREALAETGDKRYGNVDYEWPTYHDPEPEGQGAATAPDRGGQAPADGIADAGGARGGSDGSGGGQGQQGPIDPEAFREYDSPDTDRIAKAADSAWHDIEQRIDPAIAERDRQRVQMGFDAPLRGENKTGVAQEGTMGLGLFDASDQPVFDLGPGDNAGKIEAIQSALNADQDALNTITSCLTPKMGGQ
ncbi:hypothetical protein [Novosphingobium sp. FSW06-99]|uniref:hypothetical protein n=1 Tax=Novosphingobium sp. FSW06-99 TaxID=1739113 RepID=UPI0012E3F0BD|nr:hypothetical protein [Novosphingobium sp. FSW06-99]